MKVGVPKETFPGERRVALAPANIARIQKLGFEVAVERGAGGEAGFPDSAYEEAGAELVDTIKKVDVLLKVRAPTEDEAKEIEKGTTLISFLWPAQNSELVETLKDQGVTSLAMDSVPRISRAQKMDALSSMANIAGYRAVVEAANEFGRFFTGQITAAGKMPPAKVMVIGAGVAGLSAIGTARALGAIVRAFDTRPAVKEQVESMGAEFLELEYEEEESAETAGGYAKVMSKAFIEAEMALFLEQAKEVDIIVTTALIPGKKAPVLITEEMVKAMAPGSVVVDLAASQGGNCELAKCDEAVKAHGVTIIGYSDLPSRMSAQSSTLYGNNLYHMLDELGGAEGFDLDLENEVIRGSVVTHDGDLLWPAPKKEAPPPKPKPKVTEPVATPKAHAKKKEGGGSPVALLVMAVLLFGLGAVAPTGFLSHLTVFVLACFVGWQVVWSVSPALHTPLMSVTNAISGIIIVGGMLHQSQATMTTPATILGAVAILIAMINVAGGFIVTQRMLKMFRK